MRVVSVCQLSRHPINVIRWSSIEPARHPAGFDISNDLLKNLRTETIVTEIDSEALWVENDRHLQSYGKGLYGLLDSRPILCAIGFLLETFRALWRRKVLVHLPDKAFELVPMNSAG